MNGGFADSICIEVLNLDIILEIVVLEEMACYMWLQS